MITSRQIELVQQSWKLILTMDKQTNGRLFYNCLFEMAPEVKPMFSRVSMDTQASKFFSMMNYFVGHLNSPGDVICSIAKLARQHVNYGVHEEQYTLIGRSLLWTLQTIFADKWNKELNQAWIICYTMLAEAMMKTAKLGDEQTNEQIY